MDYIIFAIIGLIILSPFILWRMNRMLRTMQTLRENVSKPFACPNCGHRFYVRKGFVWSVTDIRRTLNARMAVNVMRAEDLTILIPKNNFILSNKTKKKKGKQQ